MAESRPQIPSANRVAINTTFLPFVSAKQPQKYEPSSIPNIGEADSQPLSLEFIWKSQVAAGKTKDNMVIPMAVFK